VRALDLDFIQSRKVWGRCEKEAFVALKVLMIEQLQWKRFWQ